MVDGESGKGEHCMSRTYHVVLSASEKSSVEGS